MANPHPKEAREWCSRKTAEGELAAVSSMTSSPLFLLHTRGHGFRELSNLRGQLKDEN